VELAARYQADALNNKALCPQRSLPAGFDPDKK
jgi:hypothetical protein